MKSSLALAVALAPLTLAACGDNAPTRPAEQPPAVTAPAAGVPDQTTPATTAPSMTDGQATPPSGGEQGGTDDWRRVATPADASALGRLDQAWRLGRAEAEDRGFAAQVEALGPLVDPAAALPGRLQPTPGAYRCRSIKLGSSGPGGAAYLAYPYFRCTVELTPGGDLILTKATGSQRTRGLIYPHNDRQLVFLGAQAWGADETGYPDYGDTAERDQIGVVERIGDQRWRVVMPWPKQEAKLEILDLTR